MKSHSFMLALGLLAGLFSGIACAQDAPRDRTERSTITVPNENGGDVSAESSGALGNDHSRISDRATLSDLKAGTSGSTQVK